MRHFHFAIQMSVSKWDSTKRRRNRKSTSNNQIEPIIQEANTEKQETTSGLISQDEKPHVERVPTLSEIMLNMSFVIYALCVKSDTKHRTSTHRYCKKIQVVKFMYMIPFLVRSLSMLYLEKNLFFFGSQNKSMCYFFRFFMGTLVVDCVSLLSCASSFL